MMEVEERLSVKKISEREIEVSIKGEDHTIGNMLSKEIQEVDGVELSYYSIEHPLKDVLKIYVRTDGSISPYDAFKKGLSQLKEKLEKLSEVIKKAEEKK